jgi:hypothetical protein
MIGSWRTQPGAPEHESALAIAERRVRQCEARVAQFIEALYEDGQPEGEIRARKVLAIFEDALAAARRHLESKRRRASATRSSE